MIKGFIDYREGKIPFVIENYRMELFTDNDLLSDFSKEHNFKKNYILHGQYFGVGSQGQAATFFVERSMGSTCYLRCYIINTIASKGNYDTIGFQSPFLDDVFRYKYKYLDMVREGINLALEPKVVHTIPFVMNGIRYELKYRIGQDSRLGLLEDFDKKGELLLQIQTDDIQELHDISTVLYRLTMFMLSTSEVPFQQITLYKNGLKAGWFYCPMVSEEAVSCSDGFFYQFDAMKYVPRILNNIAKDSGSRITKSIPLGHLGTSDTLFSPQRFLQQVMSFEYLFDKLEPDKAADRKFPLKAELQYMFDEFPQLLSNPNLSSGKISERIKETRHQITHGHAYYYDFKSDPELQYLIIILDKLIRNMSLWWAGFTKEEIQEYPIL